MRLVQGAMAAAGVAIGRAVVRDLYSGAAAARYLSRLMLIVGLGPILAPLVGGQLLRVTSWRGVFVALALLGLALTAMAAWLLPETLARDDRRAPGLAVTMKTFANLLADRRFVGFVLIVGFGSAAAIGYLAGSSFVLEDIYGASPQFYGVLFGINACFLVVGAQINAHMLKSRSPRRLLGFGLTALIVAGAAFLAVVVVSCGRNRRGAAAARTRHVQLELHPVERARARPHRPPLGGRDCGVAARGQPVRALRGRGTTRRSRRKRHSPANGNRDRHLRDRSRAGVPPPRACRAPTTGHDSRRAIGASLLTQRDPIDGGRRQAIARSVPEATAPTPASACS